MNKKLALLMFALGLGAANSAVMAAGPACEIACNQARVVCLRDPANTSMVCLTQFLQCKDFC